MKNSIPVEDCRLNRFSPIECDVHHVLCETESKRGWITHLRLQWLALRADVTGGAARLQLLDRRVAFQASLVFAISDQQIVGSKPTLLTKEVQLVAGRSFGNAALELVMDGAMKGIDVTARKGWDRAKRMQFG